MTISLLLAHSERDGSSVSQPTTQSSSEGIEVSNMLDHCPDHPKKATRLSGLDKLMKQKNTLVAGGNLIVCPLTLLGQWKVFGFTTDLLFVGRILVDSTLLNLVL